jgi:PTH1 family peptidyl-tRNA hydrolase
VQAIIGLGNPGSEYEGTRHNVGFAVVERLAQTLRLEFRAGRGEYLLAEKMLSGEKIVLVKPVTYMNGSGVAVKEIVERYELPLSQLLIVADDVHLPVGALRIRPDGSDGGHNGLTSIIYQLESENFPRIRCGIGSATIQVKRGELSEFVLSVFEVDERNGVESMIDRAADAALTVAVQGLQAAMNKFNTASN